MRVYWSGAAIALLADLDLRRTSGGTQSLDTVLGDLGRCCLPADRKWTDRQVVDKLDSLSKTEIFGRLYRRWLDSDRFPDLTTAYRELGLKALNDKDLRLVGGAAERQSRRAIMAGAGSTGPR
jgi:predicted metalloprotease with PDZ domain